LLSTFLQREKINNCNLEPPAGQTPQARARWASRRKSSAGIAWSGQAELEHNRAVAPSTPTAVIGYDDDEMAYTTIEREVLYTGKQVRLELHRLEDDEGRRMTREVVVHPGAVVVLAFVDERTILLVRNRRQALGQVLLELPAGTLDKGEAPMNAAGRELQEETGHLAGRMVAMGAFYTSPGILTERMYAFAAYDLQKTQMALEEGEEIEVVAVTLAEAMEMIASGEIVDGKTIATLLMHERFGVCRSQQ
jgi:ADP-ribose pyrophosphatase